MSILRREERFGLVHGGGRHNIHRRDGANAQSNSYFLTAVVHVVHGFPTAITTANGNGNNGKDHGKAKPGQDPRTLLYTPALFKYQYQYLSLGRPTILRRSACGGWCSCWLGGFLVSCFVSFAVLRCCRNACVRVYWLLHDA